MSNSIEAITLFHYLIVEHIKIESWKIVFYHKYVNIENQAGLDKVQLTVTQEYDAFNHTTIFQNFIIALLEQSEQQQAEKWYRG